MGIIQKIKEKWLRWKTEKELKNIQGLDSNDREHYCEVNAEYCTPAPNAKIAHVTSSVLQGYALAQTMSQENNDGEFFTEDFSKPWTVDDIIAEFKEEEE